MNGFELKPDLAEARIHHLLRIVNSILVVLEGTILMLRCDYSTTGNLDVILPCKMLRFFCLLAPSPYHPSFLLFQLRSILLTPDFNQTISRWNQYYQYICKCTSGALVSSVTSLPKDATAKTRKPSGLSTAVNPYLAASAAASEQTMAFPN